MKAVKDGIRARRSHFYQSSQATLLADHDNRTTRCLS